MSVSPTEAPHGEKMIEVKVRFWTNNIAEEKGKILPKHDWSSGMVSMDINESHGIQSLPPLPFKSLTDLNSVVEKVLNDHGVILVDQPSLAQSPQ